MKETYIMLFGKYKGLPLNRIPEDYLNWLSANVEKFQDIEYEIEDWIDYNPIEE